MNIQDYMKHKPLLFDGAMGTYLAGLYSQHGEESVETYNITHPDWVKEAHMRYLEAGAAAIKTNTFAVDPYGFEQYSMKQMIEQGWALACQAMEEYEASPEGKDSVHFLFADIGPISVSDSESKFPTYQKIVDCFLSCGARCFLFETLDSEEGIKEIAAYIKEKDPESFIMVSFGVSPEGFTSSGCYGRSLFYQMQQAEGIDAVGFNCISGPKHLWEMIQKLDIRNCRKHVSVMPNAGYPTVVANRTLFADNPVYFAKAMQNILEEGAAIIGGCCGTEPSYIRRIAENMADNPVKPRLLPEDSALKESFQKSDKLQDCQINSLAVAGKASENTRNDFAGKLMRGEKVIVVELDPPMTPEIDAFMEGAARYKKAGVDAIDIADCPIARARIDSSILACKVTRELKLTTIPHMTCRDRNINATKALLLGLNVEGINNVLTVTGDPVPTAQRQEVKTVFSYNSAVLARHINTLNETTFGQNPFLVSGALNINAANFDSQIRHAQKKIEHGVSVLFTQPVMTKEGLENLKRARKELPVKILGGLIPVVSHRNACFMQHEIAGIEVDERIIALYLNKNREEGEELAVKIVTEIAAQIRDYIDGYYLITPFQRIRLMEEIIKNIKEM